MHSIVNSTDLLGWLAAAATFMSFHSTDIIRLRLLALAANVCFIGFGLAGQVWPVLVLHLMLLPLNALRLAQVWTPRSDSRPNPLRSFLRAVRLS